MAGRQEVWENPWSINCLSFIWGVNGDQMHPASPEHRQQMLSMAVSAEMAQGAQILEMNQTSALLVKASPVNHVLHLLLTAFTCGVWAFVWLLVSATAQPRRFRMTVNEFGVVHRAGATTPGTGFEPHDGLWWRPNE